jgi:hypothetical protein
MINTIGNRHGSYFDSLGKACIKFIVTRRMLVLLPGSSISSLHHIRSKVNESMLTCFFERYGLCSEVKERQASRAKSRCGQVMISLIGIMYYYLTSILEIPDAYNHIELWLRQHFELDQAILDSRDNKRISCSIDHIPIVDPNNRLKRLTWPPRVKIPTSHAMDNR